MKRGTNERAETRRRSSDRPPPGSLGKALLLTAAATVVPGSAHLARGRRRSGALLFGLYLAGVAFVVFAATRPGHQLVAVVLQPRWLLGIGLAAIGIALTWSASIVWSYRVVRPSPMSVPRRFVAVLTVTALCAVICVPLLWTANLARQQRALLNALFPDTEISEGSGGSDPWSSGERLNVLLLGADAHPGDVGIRTDVMILASVDPTTGKTVLFSIPRNLQYAPMPFPEVAEEFPDGFPDFLFGLWRYGARHPELVPGGEDAGATLLTATISEILGLPVDYYVLIDLAGFKKLIDALGGVWIKVLHPIPYGPNGQHVVEAGYRRLSGREALWYARSRTGTSDYDRMRRQRCLLGALVRQADPMTVLTNFQELATATKRAVSTNIPQDLLPHLARLAPKIAGSTITNIQLVPPLVDTGDPNYARIQRIVGRVIDGLSPTTSPPEKGRSPDASPPGHATGTPGAESSSPGTPSPSNAPSAEPTTVDERQPGADTTPVSLQAACPTMSTPQGQ